MYVGPDERPALSANVLEKALAIVSDAVIIIDVSGFVVYQNGASEHFLDRLDDHSVSELLINLA